MISVAPLCHHRELLIELAAARIGALTKCAHFELTCVSLGKKVSLFYCDDRIGTNEVSNQGHKWLLTSSFSGPKKSKLKEVLCDILFFRNIKKLCIDE